MMDDSISYLTILLAIYGTYICAVYYVFYNQRIKRKRLKDLNMSIISIFLQYNSDNIDYESILEQIKINYINIYRNEKYNNKLSMMNLLSTLLSKYDILSDIRFEKIFQVEKDVAVRNFIYKIYLYAKSTDPFSLLPAKEASLLTTLEKSIENNNKEFSANIIEQLSTEIYNKEQIIEKQHKDNQKAMIVSIVGVILTIVFGVLTFFE